MTTPKAPAAHPLGEAAGSPFVVPPFDGKLKLTTDKYSWWSWHPMYPYWSRSCWGGATEAEAMTDLERQECGLDVYHNKLIRENQDGTLTEVLDVPCKRLDVWEKCRANEKGEGQP